MSDQVADLKETCLLSNNIYDYWYVSQGKTTVPSIDVKEDMQFADEAFDILGFSNEEKYDVYRNTACMMHMSQFPQPQHKFAPARDSGTFGSIIMDPSMVTLDPSFYIWKIQAWKERIFFVPDFLMD